MEIFLYFKKASKKVAADGESRKTSIFAMPQPSKKPKTGIYYFVL